MNRTALIEVFNRGSDVVGGYRDLMDTHDVDDLVDKMKLEALALLDVDEVTSVPAPVLVGMSRAEALETARQHVEAMSTKANGVKLSDKVSAVDRLARFLMGENE